VMAYAGVRVGVRIFGGGGGTEEAVRDSEQLALDRVWIDHMPRDERDTVSVFVAITEEPLGVFQTSSVWKGNFEMFRYQAKGNDLRIVYPQNNERETVKASARRCNDSGWDYCLELDGSTRGVKRYFSRKGWEIDGVRGRDLRGRIAGLVQPGAAQD
jgi:hypothetical protein